MLLINTIEHDKTEQMNSVLQLNKKLKFKHKRQRN